MIFQATHVYLIYCSYIPDPHPKFSICVCPTWARFLWINSDPRRTKPGSQILITPNDLACLNHDSYIDTGKMVTFPPSDLKTAKPKGILKPSIIKNIKSVINEHQYLTGNQIKIIMKNFKE